MKPSATALDYLAAAVVVLGAGVAILTRELAWVVVAFAGVTLVMRRWLKNLAGPTP